LNIKYSKKKEELRRDPVLEALAGAKEFITAQSDKIVTALVIIILIFGGSQIFSYVRKSGRIKAQNDFGRAMLLYSGKELSQAQEAFEEVIGNHGNSSQAGYSAFMIGHIYLIKEKYDDAIEYFEKAYANKNKIGFVRGESLEALATCYEAQGDLEAALEFYQKALNDETIVYRYPAIRWKMALINKKLGNSDKVKLFCSELVSDTLALEYKKMAENLLATM